MRSKNNTTDGLISALKQLKIYDRRSRRSFGNRSASYRGWNRGFSFRPLLSYPKATDSLSLQLDTYHACEYCVLNYQPTFGCHDQCGDVDTAVITSLSGCVSSLPLPNHGTSSPRSDFSLFSASTDVGCTLSMYPERITSNLTGEKFRLQSLSSVELHWHSDTSSSSLVHESATRPVSVGANNFSGAYYTARHHCCLHPSPAYPVPPTNHMRLYRRLYSLIDHPCVSVYRSLCKSHLSDINDPAVFGRAKLSKHWNPTLPNANISICPHSITLDKKQVMCGEITAPVISSTQSISQQPCANSSACAVTSPVISSAQFQSAVCGDDPRGLLAYRRTRRNSDPQHWQQNRAEESDVTDERGRFNRLSVSYFGRNLPLSSKLVAGQNLGESAVSRNTVFQSNDSNYHQPFDVSISQQLISEVDTDQNLFAIGHSTAPRSVFIPNTSTSSACPSGFRVLHPTRIDDPGDCISSGDTTPQLIPDFTQKLLKPLVPTGRFSTHAGGDSESGPGLRCLDHELSLIEGTESEPGANVSDTSRPLLTDVSVNELASYMEHMVHIPGRMSEMAQRMYL